MEGKNKCNILKGIRQRIADINGIVYIPHPCENTINCMGTCPMCENELAWLEKMLQAKLAEGHRIYISKYDLENYEKCLKKITNI